MVIRTRSYPQPQDNNPVSWMLYYRYTLDLCPFPIDPLTKKPLIRWKRFQTEQPSAKEIEFWGLRFQNAMSIALVTGCSVGMPLVVADSDSREVVPPAGKGWGVTPVTHTARGEHHLYTNRPGRTVPRTVPGLFPKLDLKGAGGYVLAPPSLHPSGARYSFALSPEETNRSFANLPEWVYEAIEARQNTRSPQGPRPSVPADPTLLGAILAALPGPLEQATPAGWMNGLCPFHDDKEPSFGINPQQGIWNCFVCGGGAIGSLAWRLDIRTEHLAGAFPLPDDESPDDEPFMPDMSFMDEAPDALEVPEAPDAIDQAGERSVQAPVRRAIQEMDPDPEPIDPLEAVRAEGPAPWEKDSLQGTGRTVVMPRHVEADIRHPAGRRRVQKWHFADLLTNARSISEFLRKVSKKRKRKPATETGEAAKDGKPRTSQRAIRAGWQGVTVEHERRVLSEIEEEIVFVETTDGEGLLPHRDKLPAKNVLMNLFATALKRQSVGEEQARGMLNDLQFCHSQQSWVCPADHIQEKRAPNFFCQFPFHDCAGRTYWDIARIPMKTLRDGGRYRFFGWTVTKELRQFTGPDGLPYHEAWGPVHTKAIEVISDLVVKFNRWGSSTNSVLARSIHFNLGPDRTYYQFLLAVREDEPDQLNESLERAHALIAGFSKLVWFQQASTTNGDFCAEQLMYMTRNHLVAVRGESPDIFASWYVAVHGRHLFQSYGATADAFAQESAEAKAEAEARPPVICTTDALECRLCITETDEQGVTRIVRRARVYLGPRRKKAPEEGSDQPAAAFDREQARARQSAEDAQIAEVLDQEQRNQEEEPQEQLFYQPEEEEQMALKRSKR